MKRQNVSVNLNPSLQKMIMKSFKLFAIASLVFVLAVQNKLHADDANVSQQIENDDQTSTAPLSAAELREKLARGRLEKKIESLFRRSKFVKSGDRPHIDDYFVVAKFQMPLQTREAELRFEVTQGMKESSIKMADYLVATPMDQVRDFRVLTRFKSPDEAEQGVQFVRKQYDEFKEYQARMMRSMQQARSMQRC